MPDPEASNPEALALTQRLLNEKLPAVTQSAKTLLLAMQEGTLSYQAMSDQVQNDPVLALGLLSEANRAIKGEESLVKTLSQAISLLGEDLLKRLLTETPPPSREQSPGKRHQQIAMSMSYVAAHLARRLAIQRFNGREEDCYWAALFWGAPFWYLGRLLPKMAESLVDQPPRTREQANARMRASFKCSLDDYWRASQATLHLNETIREAYPPADFAHRRLLSSIRQHCQGPLRKHLLSYDNRAGRIYLAQPSTLVWLCNQTAFGALESWHSKRCDSALKLLAVLCQQPYDHIRREAQMAAVDAARLHPLSSACLWLQELFLTPEAEPEKTPENPAPSETRPAKPEQTVPGNAAPPVSRKENSLEDLRERAPARKAMAEAPPDKPAQKPPALPDAQLRGNHDLFMRLNFTMREEPESFRDMAHLMDTLTRCLVSGAGFDTASVLLTNKQLTVLKTYFIQGADTRPDLPELLMPVQAPLLKKLVQKQAAIWISPEKITRMRPQLPAELMESNHTESFMLYSLLVNKRPIALVYADGGEGQQTFSDFDYQRFKEACSAASHVLYYLARKQNQKTKE